MTALTEDRGLPRVAVVVIGEANDAGFNSSGLAGARKAANTGIADISVIDGLSYDEAEIAGALGGIVPECDGLVFIGGQGDRVVPALAERFPDKAFAVVQGQGHGANLASYDVLQEQSAFLAGCLAAWMTRSGVVAHLSGHRVRPGLKARAAFVGGVRHAGPEVRVLTSFCGTQDDNEVTRRWAAAQLAAGADILFTMLNGARRGAIEACYAAGAWQIGNALDWTVLEPDVFMASAIARIDEGVVRAIADIAAGRTPEHPVRLGLAEGDHVGLSLGATVPQDVARRIEAVTAAIASGDIAIEAAYDGPEFALEADTCLGTG